MIKIDRDGFYSVHNIFAISSIKRAGEKEFSYPLDMDLHNLIDNLVLDVKYKPENTFFQIGIDQNTGDSFVLSNLEYYTYIGFPILSKLEFEEIKIDF